MSAGAAWRFDSHCGKEGDEELWERGHTLVFFNLLFRLEKHLRGGRPPSPSHVEVSTLSDAWAEAQNRGSSSLEVWRWGTCTIDYSGRGGLPNVMFQLLICC